MAPSSYDADAIEAAVGCQQRRRPVKVFLYCHQRTVSAKFHPREKSVMDEVKNILVAVDLSGDSETVARVAAGFAGAFSAKLYFLHVVRDDPAIFGDRDVPAERDEEAREFREEHRELEELRKKVTQPGMETVVLQVQGQTVNKILSEARKLDIGLLVVGGHKDNLRHLISGDVVKGVLNGASCPVVVVPPAAG
jgi:nucleotide-binding universal stress UspA family protein